MDEFAETRAALAERFGWDAVLVPINEVAKYLHVDRRTLIADKTFPIKMVGNQYRVPVIGLTRWLSSR